MKVSKEQAQRNRDAIVDAAAKLYRERGFEGVGVADIAREAGFTHGGFYGHFESKEALAAEACERSFETALSRLADRLAKPEGLDGFITNYLSTRSRDNPGQACPMGTLSVDAARSSGPVATTFGHGIGHYLEALAQHRPDGNLAESISDADKQRAITTLASLVGAMVLARATHEALPALSDEILSTVRRSLRADSAG